MTSTAAGCSEFAPAAIAALFDRVNELLGGVLELGGILGDQAHRYGYHRGRCALPADDYSCTLPRDLLGRPGAASALDITPRDGSLMPVLTRRLRRAAELHDSRLHPLREYFGTLDGKNVYGWDFHTRSLSTSDSSHLWHLHLSIHRDVACHKARLLPIADVLAGR